MYVHLQLKTCNNIKLQKRSKYVSSILSSWR